MVKGQQAESCDCRPGAGIGCRMVKARRAASDIGQRRATSQFLVRRGYVRQGLAGGPAPIAA
jgi:hypothetical protein